LTFLQQSQQPQPQQQQISPTKEYIEYELDFLSHFNQDKLFPRTVQTKKSEGRQIEIFSKQEALYYYEESSFIDCRINAFPSYTEYKGVQRYPPDLIFIDIDRSNFKDDKSFENALSKTKRNIKEKINGHPTINNSGNGYHVIQPIECPIFEQIEQFQKYKDIFFVSQEFLRFAEKYLTNGKSDPNHHPSFKSCQIRVPGSINGKCLVENREKRLSENNFKVKTLQKWDVARPLVTREFLEDFRTYLEQKVTDQENNNYNYNYKKKNNSNNQNHYSNNNYIEWIENKVLQTPLSDYRKLIVGLILSPYLIVIKKLSYEESYKVIYKWLQKCNSLSGRRLDFDPRYLINNNIKTSMRKLIPPISINKLETNYTSLYLLLLQDQNNNNNNNNTMTK